MTDDRAPLRRTPDDRVIAGVAGGVGEYFGVDPVLVRIGFIMLAFLGGAGLALYLMGWVVLPARGSGSIVTNALRSDAPHRVRSVIALLLAGLGLLIVARLSNEIFELFLDLWTDTPYTAFMLIAAGIALVLWPRTLTSRKDTPSQAQPQDPVAAPSPTGPSATDAIAADIRVAAAAPAPPPMPAGRPKKRTRRPRRRPRSMVGLLTIAALLVFTGGAVVLDRLGVVGVNFSASVAIAVVITGAGLVVSAFTGPARGLIFFGVVVLMPPLILSSGSDVSWWSGIGDHRIEVDELPEQWSEYRHGVGRLVVDLRRMELDHSAERSLSVGVMIGEVVVYVPDSLNLTFDAEMMAGEFSLIGGERSRVPPRADSSLGSRRSTESGLALDLDVDIMGRGSDGESGKLHLELDVGLGNARVIIDPAGEA